MAKNVSIGISNFNIAPLDALRWKAGRYMAFLQATGCAPLIEEGVAGYRGGGFTWNYINGKGHVAQRLAADNAIQGLEQSWRTEQPRHVLQAAQTGSILKVVKGATFILGLPGVEESLERLETVQEAAGKKLPIVVHPNEQRHDQTVPVRHINYGWLRDKKVFGNMLYQPTSDLLEGWGITLPDRPTDNDIEAIANELVAVQGEHGFDGIAFDTHHANTVRGRRRPLPAPIALVGHLAAQGAIHTVEVGFRPDLGGNREHLRSALSGNLETTPQGAMLRTVLQYRQPDQETRIVLEVPASAMPRGLEYQQGNQQLVGAIAQLATAA
ncbi:MAG TPA: hypothetical protein VMY99_02720 [Nevskiaceae bacterium]|nr:hypothetical protein [Nevskiaceae bacterium]